MDLDIHFIYGELPHFSSSLVRRAPGHWRSFLTQTVVPYLDARQHLLEQLILNLNADAAQEEMQKQQKQSKIQKAGDGASDVSSYSSTTTRANAGTGTTGTSTTIVSSVSAVFVAAATHLSQEEQHWQERKSVAAASVMHSLQGVHALQIERGRTGLYLSMGPTDVTACPHLTTAQADTD